MPDPNRFESLARQYAEKYGIDPDIFARQIRQESGFNPNAVSPKGARGMAQFMPETGRRYGLTRKEDFHDPDKALDAGARLMRDNLKRYGGDYAKTLAAYNAGEGAVDKYGGVPPYKETQNYVKTILGGKPSVGRRQTGAARLSSIIEPNLASGLNQSNSMPSSPSVLDELLNQKEPPMYRAIINEVMGTTGIDEPTAREYLSHPEGKKKYPVEFMQAIEGHGMTPAPVSAPVGLAEPAKITPQVAPAPARAIVAPRQNVPRATKEANRAKLLQAKAEQKTGVTINPWSIEAAFESAKKEGDIDRAREYAKDLKELGWEVGGMEVGKKTVSPFDLAAEFYNAKDAGDKSKMAQIATTLRDQFKWQGGIGEGGWAYIGRDDKAITTPKEIATPSEIVFPYVKPPQGLERPASQGTESYLNQIVADRKAENRRKLIAATDKRGVFLRGAEGIMAGVGAFSGDRAAGAGRLLETITDAFRSVPAGNVEPTIGPRTPGRGELIREEGEKAAQASREFSADFGQDIVSKVGQIGGELAPDLLLSAATGAPAATFGASSGLASYGQGKPLPEAILTGLVTGKGIEAGSALSVELEKLVESAAAKYAMRSVAQAAEDTGTNAALQGELPDTPEELIRQAVFATGFGAFKNKRGEIPAEKGAKTNVDNTNTAPGDLRQGQRAETGAPEAARKYEKKPGDESLQKAITEKLQQDKDGSSRAAREGFTPEERDYINRKTGRNRKAASAQAPAQAQAPRIVTKAEQQAASTETPPVVEKPLVKKAAGELARIQEEADRGIYDNKVVKDIAALHQQNGDHSAIVDLYNQVAEGRKAAGFSPLSIEGTPIKPPASAAPTKATGAVWQQEVDTLAAHADKLGISDKIEAYAARGLSSKEIASQLGFDIDVVRAVRAKRQIPAHTDPDFVTWRSGFNQRMLAKRKASVAAPTTSQSQAPTPQSTPAAPVAQAKPNPLKPARPVAPQAQAPATPTATTKAASQLSVRATSNRDGQGIFANTDVTGWQAKKVNEHGMILLDSPDGKNYMYVKPSDLSAQQKQDLGVDKITGQEAPNAAAPENRYKPIDLDASAKDATPAERSFIAGDKPVTVTDPESIAAFDAAKAKHDRAVEVAKGMSDRTSQGKAKKAAGLQFAADKRKIANMLTLKEAKRAEQKATAKIEAPKLETVGEAFVDPTHGEVREYARAKGMGTEGEGKAKPIEANAPAESPAITSARTRLEDAQARLTELERRRAKGESVGLDLIEQQRLVKRASNELQLLTAANKKTADIEGAKKDALEIFRKGETPNAETLINQYKITPGQARDIIGEAAKTRIDEKFKPRNEEERSPYESRTMSDALTPAQNTAIFKITSEKGVDADFVAQEKYGTKAANLNKKTALKFIADLKNMTPEQIADYRKRSREAFDVKNPGVRESVEKALEPRIVAEARTRNQERLSGKRLSSNPVDALIDNAITTGYDIYKGTKDFAAWSKDMVEKLGDEIKPHLEKVFTRIRESGMKTKIVNEKGEPLIVYHGTKGDFTEFESGAASNVKNMSGLGFYFTPNESKAWDFAHAATTRPSKAIQGKISSLEAELKPLGEKLKFMHPSDEGYLETFRAASDRIQEITSLERESNTGTANIKEATLDIKNPASYSVSQFFKLKKNGELKPREKVTEMRARLEKQGHDGVIIEAATAKEDADLGLNGEFTEPQYVAFHPEQIKSTAKGLYGETITKEQQARIDAARAQEGGFLGFGGKPKLIDLARYQSDKGAKGFNKFKLEAAKNGYTDKAAIAKAWNDAQDLPPVRSIKDLAIDVANVPRSLQSSFDLSAPLRQGAILSLSHPSLAFKAGVEMVKALKKTSHEKIMADMEKHPAIDAAREADLYLSKDANSLGEREEAFMSQIVGKLVAPSERAYTTYLDKLRLDAFGKFKESLGKEATPQDLKDIAKFINSATGRGEFKKGGALEGAAPILNGLMFSPRYLKSRIDVLNPVRYKQMTPAARKIALTEMARYVGVVGMTLAMAKLAGAEVNVTDPESSDWLKIKVGDTKYDVGAGLQQLMRFSYRFSKSAALSATGKLGKKDQDALAILGKFARSKEAPSVAFAHDVLTGKDFIGRPTNTGKSAAEHLPPLFLKDLYEAYREEGLLGVGKTAPGVLGVGTQTFKNKGASGGNASALKF